MHGNSNIKLLTQVYQTPITDIHTVDPVHTTCHAQNMGKRPCKFLVIKYFLNTDDYHIREVNYKF